MSGRTEKRLRAENDALRLELEAKKREVAAHAYLAHHATLRLAWSVGLAGHADRIVRRPFARFRSFRYLREFLRLIRCFGGADAR